MLREDATLFWMYSRKIRFKLMDIGAIRNRLMVLKQERSEWFAAKADDLLDLIKGELPISLDGEVVRMSDARKQIRAA